MRLYEKWRPRSLSAIVGQPGARVLAAWCRQPYPECFLLQGPGGTGKTSAAFALARDLGVDPDDDLAGFYVVKATELTIDACRELWGRTLHCRPLSCGPWRVLLIEELEAVTSVQVQRFLKTALETELPRHTVVVATSNGAGAIDEILLQRFKLLHFSGGKVFGSSCRAFLGQVWQAETGDTELPAEAKRWGWNGSEKFSLRSALDQMQTAMLLAVAA